MDELIASEDVGVAKPDPRIFEIALARLGTSAAEAVMVGDSWANDVAGAHALGIRAIWFNPDRAPRPAVPAGVEELHSLVPAAEVAALLLGARRASS